MEAPSEQFGSPLDRSLVPGVWEGLREAIATHQNKIALVCAHQPHDLFGFGSIYSPQASDPITALGNKMDMDHPAPYLRWTFQTMARGISRLIESWRKTPTVFFDTKVRFGSGTPVITFLHNGAEFVLAAWAAISTGCVLIPLNPLERTDAGVITHMLQTALKTVPKDQTMAIVLAADEDMAELIDELSPTILGPYVPKVLAARCTPKHGWLPFEDLIHNPDAFNQGTGGVLDAGLDRTSFTGAGLVTLYEVDNLRVLSVGRPPMGHGIKIVDPMTGSIVPRNKTGEICGCGLMVEREENWGYIGGEGNEAFYKDKIANRIWFRSGDMGFMDESGMTFVVGRILREGEHISPEGIEAILLNSPGLSNLDPKVVGAKDPVAGEVPVVVLKNAKPSSSISRAVQSTVLVHMGPIHVPSKVIFLEEDLHVDDYPRTSSGRIQRSKLKELVADFMERKTEILYTSNHAER